MRYEEIINTAMRQSAADYSCHPEDFRRNAHVVVESKPAEGVSRYLKNPQVCALVSYGTNVVVSCRRDLIPAVTEYVNRAETACRCFESPAVLELDRILHGAGARLFGMHAFYLPDPEAVFGEELPCPYETRELHPEDFAGLYVPQWGNALSSGRRELDVLGFGAYDGDRLVGLAGCSADCAEMWQIGIDVLPEYRRQGVASALTNRLARAVFAHGKVPFYGAAWSNVPSARNAVKSGFRPAWVSVDAVLETR